MQASLGLGKTRARKELAQDTAIYGLENCWRSAAASRIGKLEEMHCDGARSE